MQEYTKLEAASRQLDMAIQLFLEGDHLCSVTLAGAAEEILGKLLISAGQLSAMDEIKTSTIEELVRAGVTTTQKEVADTMNAARNAAKHNGAGGDRFSLEWPDSFTMLLRAIPMAIELGAPTENHRMFYRWWVAHWQEVEDFRRS